MVKMNKGLFKKGHKTNLGRKMSEKTKIKIGLANKGKISWCAGKKRLPFTEEHKKNISLACKGRKIWCEGKKLTKEHRNKLSLSHKGLLIGVKHPQYKGGKYIGHRLETEQWDIIRKKVYKRDNWTCQICGKHCHKNIQCHHIIPYRHSLDDGLSNLITLCVSCHKKEEIKYYRKLNGQMEIDFT
jgi:hypothetical protein